MSRLGLTGAGVAEKVAAPAAASTLNTSTSASVVINPVALTDGPDPRAVAAAEVFPWSSASSGPPLSGMTSRSDSVLLASVYSPLLHCEMGRP